MTIDILKLLAVLAGFAMIAAATALAFRQTMSWQHVIVFCLGGVLAGISGVQLQGSDTSWSVSIGQLADATAKANQAAQQQSDALAALNSRVDNLQAALQALHTPEANPAATNAKIDSLLTSSNTQRARIADFAAHSRQLTINAGASLGKLQRLQLQPAHP